MNAPKEHLEGHFAASFGEDNRSVLAHDIALAFAHNLIITMVGDDVVLVGVLREVAKSVRERGKVGADLHRAGQELEPFHVDQLTRPSPTSSSRQSRTSIAGGAARSKASRSSSGNSTALFVPLHSASRIAPV